VVAFRDGDKDGGGDTVLGEKVGGKFVELNRPSTIEGFMVLLKVSSMAGFFVSVAKTACPGLEISLSVTVVGAIVTVTESPTGGTESSGATGSVGLGADTGVVGAGGETDIVGAGLLEDVVGQLHPHVPRICSVIPHMPDGMIPSRPYVMISPQVASVIGEGGGRDMTASGLSSVQSGFPHK
jgi:hypothetical protein